jgi:ParB-like chromosome segregation protein Spo0J
MTPLTFHPLANVFPLLEGEPFNALVADIKASGLCEPVWLYDGQVLDGRNRYRACQRLGQDCATRPYTGDDPLSFVLSMNLQRRHLDESQRAMIAARLATMRRGERTDLVEISTSE